MGLKSVRKGTNVNEATPVPEKNRVGLEKGLANLWSRKKNMKRHTLVVGKKLNGKSQLGGFIVIQPATGHLVGV